MERIDLLIKNAAQLVTCAAPDGPKRGTALGEVEIIEDGAVGVVDGRIHALGPTSDLTARYTAAETIDAAGHAVVPGFVDAHTHLIFGGDRVAEFEMRLAGASYMEIMAAGGGIRSTVAQTRAATEVDLFAAAAARLREMLALGTTTVEVKSGYGLETETELKILRVCERLQREAASDLIPTFLGAHTLPPEFADDAAGYMMLLEQEILPAAAAWYSTSAFAYSGIPFFIDVFCEDHAFDVQQSAQILDAGRAYGLRGKIHVDQFNRLGGVPMAVQAGVTSVDHLEATTEPDISLLAASAAVSVLLPAVNFNLGLTTFAPARELIDRGAAVALATDLNPGSAPCFSLPFVMALACRYMGMTPAEALHAVTINAAHAVGMAEWVGSLEVGKQADLLILQDADYRHLTYFFGHNPVNKVIKCGKIVS
jgi:imidazolonepropionase